MNDTEIFVKSEECVFREEEEGAFLFNPETGNLKFINQTGVIVYQLCSSERTLCELVDILSEQYEEVPREVIEKDVKNFILPLVEMGFLKQKKSNEYNR